MKNDDLKVPRLRFAGFGGEWKSKKLNEVLDKVSEPVKVEIGKTYREVGIRSHGKGLFHKEPILGETLGDKRVFWIKENAFIVNIVFAWEQAIARTTSNEIGFIASHRFPMFQSKNQLADIDFIFYLFSTKKGKSLLELASPGGAGRNKTLGQKEFDNLKLTLPTLPEQKKIAAFLTLADEKINQLARKKQLLETYKKGVMQGLFSQKVRFAGFEGEWEVKRLGEVANVKMGQSPESIYYNNEGLGLPLIQGNADLSNRRTNPKMFSSRYTKECNVGDIILSVRAPVGAASKSIHNACIGRGVCSISSNGLIIQDFLFQWLIDFEPKWREFEQGSTFTAINGNDIKMVEIALPSLAEQEKIAKCLTAIDEKIGAVSGQLAAARVWKKGLLQQLFV